MSLIRLSTGRSCSSSWQAASIRSPFYSRFNGIAIVNGRVYTSGSVIVAS